MILLQILLYSAVAAACGAFAVSHLESAADAQDSGDDSGSWQHSLAALAFALGGAVMAGFLVRAVGGAA